MKLKKLVEPVTTYLRGIRDELNRVAWAPKDVWKASALAVLSALVLVMLFFGVVDFLISVIVRRLLY
ncbi:MAG: preprotein translocase subunit SecE [bacterium]